MIYMYTSDFNTLSNWEITELYIVYAENCVIV